MAKKDHSTKFYCYAHRTADTGHIFYIGKGFGNRSHLATNRSRYWHNKANKHGFTVEIITTGLTERQAFDMEREFIEFYGRDKLVNLTDGGEGCSGRKASEKEKQRLKTNNPMHNPEIAKKISIAKTGVKRENISGSLHFRSKKILCTETGVVFETITKAEEWLRKNGYEKASNTNIVKQLKGNRKIAYGYHWEYVDK